MEDGGVCGGGAALWRPVACTWLKSVNVTSVQPPTWHRPCTTTAAAMAAAVKAGHGGSAKGSSGSRGREGGDGKRERKQINQQAERSTAMNADQQASRAFNSCEGRSTGRCERKQINRQV
eukprot:121294-Chlamydomonas_euryale.AAC.9